jgi:pantoate--beta-alanine ligase
MGMLIVETIADLRNSVADMRRSGKSIGFVPTMGYLHEGHASLLVQAKAECDETVLSIFVNPLQFGPNEDFERYPRNIEHDMEIARQCNISLVFCPSVSEMYPDKIKTIVSVSGLTERLCGASRPGHFDGVATVVLKLLNQVQPDKIYMGLKDYQQVLVVTQMVRDLNMPVEVIPCPIVRESDGLAKSSRNVYLSPQERQSALILYNTLQRLAQQVEQGERDVNLLRNLAVSSITAKSLVRIDYVEILESRTLLPIDLPTEQILVAFAVFVGKTRLIDNIIFTTHGSPFHV